MAASRLGQPDSRPHEVFVQWRLAALAGATAGLGLAPFASLADPALGSLLVAAAAALMVARPRAGAQPSTAPRRSGAVAAPWLALVALTACGAGLALGGVRVGAIDAAAFDRLAERPVTATGFVTAVPRRSRGVVSVRVETADGRLLVEAPEPVPELRVGHEVRASGTLREAEPWQAGYLRVHGIALVLEAERIELTGARRGGLAGLSDRVRDRAEVALERGMPPDQAALARGFVLGQDDRIDPETVDEFKRSGLAHLLWSIRQGRAGSRPTEPPSGSPRTPGSPDVRVSPRRPNQLANCGGLPNRGPRATVARRSAELVAEERR